MGVSLNSVGEMYIMLFILHCSIGKKVGGMPRFVLRIYIKKTTEINF